jgi:uncharacterized protein (TIGR00369 family)
VLGFEETPFNRALRLQIADGDAGASIVATIEPWFQQENGVIHGGIIAAVADTSAVYAFRRRLEKNEQMTGLEFKINFLLPATMEGGPMTARAAVVRRGRTIGVCDAEVYQNGQLIAKRLFTYVFLAR